MDIFDNSILKWIHRQSALYFCTLFQFMLGAFALKFDWQKKLTMIYEKFRFNNLMSVFFIIIAIVIHGAIPNFIIAPFTALIFIFAFTHMRLSHLTNKSIDFFSKHSTNIWLIHMFFYMIYFKEFIYAFKYVPLIYLVLIVLCVACSYIVNLINNFLIKKI